MEGGFLYKNREARMQDTPSNPSKEAGYRDK